MITDLHMPEMDGFDLVAAVRAHPVYRNLPAVLLTSSAAPGDQERCCVLGVAAKLLKPAGRFLYLLDNLVSILAGGNRSSPQAVRAPVDAPVTPEHGVLQVLLAEDNQVNQKFATQILRAGRPPGHRTYNGRQAVDLSGTVGRPRAHGCSDARNGRLGRDAGNPPTRVLETGVARFRSSP